MTDTKNTAKGLSIGLASVPDGVRELGLDVTVDNPGAGVGNFAVGSAGTSPDARVTELGPFTFGFARAQAEDDFDEAVAFGLFVEALDGTDRRDFVSGSGVVQGTTQAEVRGVSIGKDIAGDPDVIEGAADGNCETDNQEGGPGVEDFIPIVRATVDLGDGDDRVVGTSRLQVDAGEAAPIFYANNAVIVDRGSILAFGDGDDLVRASARTRAETPAATDQGLDGISIPDPDTEIITDGIENVGLIDMGAGDDRVQSRIDSRAVAGATLINDGIDNSSVGNPNPAGDPDLDRGARFVLGAGDDRVDIRVNARNESEGSIANGWDNRSLVDLGDGDDAVRLVVRNTFRDTPDIVGEQEEVIADGRATGNGVLTNAGAIDSRGSAAINAGVAIDAGAGDDLLHGRVVGRVTAPVAGAENAGQATPKTLINGYLLESGGGVSRNFMRDGDDTIDVKAEAFGRATDTAAIGMNAISINIPAIGRRTFTDLGDGDDRVIAVGVGEGTGKVAAYGLNGGELVAGDGDERITGEGRVDAGADVEATGIRLDDDFTLFGGTGEAESDIESDEGAELATGEGNDTVTGIARLGADVARGGAVGVHLGEAGTLAVGDGDDTVTATAVGEGSGKIAAFGFAGGGPDTGAGDDTVTGAGRVIGGGEVEAVGIGLDEIALFAESDTAIEPTEAGHGGVFATGDGDDTVTGTARLGDRVDDGDAVGIRLGEAGRLTTGKGDDTVVGRAESAADAGDADAIAGDAASLLDTGEGDDVVDAEEGWFAGGFTLRLGAGDDLVRGFGDVVIDGGDGHDTLEIDFSLHHLASVGGTVRRDAEDGFVVEKLHWRLAAYDVETFAFTDGDVAADHLETAFDTLVA